MKKQKKNALLIKQSATTINRLVMWCFPDIFLHYWLWACPSAFFYLPAALELTWTTLFLWQISITGLAEANCWGFRLRWDLIVNWIAWLSPLVRICRSMALPVFMLSPDTSFIAVWPWLTWLWTPGESKHQAQSAYICYISHWCSWISF